MKKEQLALIVLTIFLVTLTIYGFIIYSFSESVRLAPGQGSNWWEHLFIKSEKSKCPELSPIIHPLGSWTGCCRLAHDIVCDSPDENDEKQMQQFCQSCLQLGQCNANGSFIGGCGNPASNAWHQEAICDCHAAGCYGNAGPVPDYCSQYN